MHLIDLFLMLCGALVAGAISAVCGMSLVVWLSGRAAGRHPPQA